MIGDVKGFESALRAIPLLELEVLEYGEGHGTQSRVTEDIPPHVAVSSQRRSNKERVAICGHVAATRLQRCSRRGVGCTPCNRRRNRKRWRNSAVYGRNGARNAGLRSVKSAIKAAAVRNADLAGSEVGGIAEDVPAIGVFAGPAEIIPAVPCRPRLGPLNIHA